MSAGLELRFEARADHLASIRACVERYGRTLGFGDETVGRIALAVDEAIANVIRHAYEGRDDGPVTVRLSPLEHGGIRVEVEDEGTSFDPSSIEPRDLDEVRPGGLGLHIIRSTFARCDWRPRDLGGMIAVLELPLSDDKAKLSAPPSLRSSSHSSAARGANGTAH